MASIPALVNPPAPIVLDDAAGLELAAEVIDRQTAEATKRSYASAIKKLKNWLLSNHPEYLTGTNATPIAQRNVMLPISGDILLSFFGAAQRMNAQGTQRPATEQPIAHSSMGIIQSAISDLYRSASVTMDPQTKARIESFMSGYKRKMQDLKQIGQMAVFEGKRAILEFTRVGELQYSTIYKDLLKMSHTA